MQPVSAHYNAYPDVREVGVGVTFRLVDVGAAGNAAVSSNGAEPISILSQLLTGDETSPGKIMTMEDDLVQTDGTWDILQPGQTVPFWSTALSDQDGIFQTPVPTLTFSLSNPASSIGFTFLFDGPAGCWPSKIRVTVYNGSSQLVSQEFRNSEAELKCELSVSDYDRVTIEFLETQEPYRRIKMYAILFGIVQDFDASTIASMTIRFGCSPDASNIESTELSFTFDNSDAKYNMISPTGLYRYLQDGQVIQSSISIDGESIIMPLCYFTRSEATDEALTATITANDKIYTLDSTPYNGGSSGTWTLQEAVTAILGVGEICDFGSFGNITVGRAIPQGTSKRESIRLLAQAAKCTCWIERDGTFVFRNLSIAQSSVDTLNKDNLYSLSGVSVQEPIDSVVLTVRDSYAETDEKVYTAGTGENVRTVDNPCVVDGQGVANWLLSINKQRLVYSPKNRGNPAVDIGDTLTIYNAYSEAGRAVLYSQELIYDGGLQANTKALGAAWE